MLGASFTHNALSPLFTFIHPFTRSLTTRHWPASALVIFTPRLLTTEGRRQSQNRHLVVHPPTPPPAPTGVSLRSQGCCVPSTLLMTQA